MSRACSQLALTSKHRLHLGLVDLVLACSETVISPTLDLLMWSWALSVSSFFVHFLLLSNALIGVSYKIVVCGPPEFVGPLLFSRTV